MVNVKDLMVGNFVKTPIGVVEVYNIINDAIIADTRDICYVKGLEGIPITKELLKKIGFEKDTTAGEPWPYWRYWDKDGRYKLDVYPEEFFCNSNRKFGLHVDNDVCNTIGTGEFTYVHELQNLTRCITGHSLPITKEVFDGLGNDA